MALRFADAGADCILLDIDETGLLSVLSRLQTMGGQYPLLE